MIRRTSIEVDDALLREAQEVLGTSGLKDTVDRALIEVVRAERRRRLARQLRDGTAFDFDRGALDRETQWRV